jgi:hemin uptake protein HemP
LFSFTKTAVKPSSTPFPPASGARKTGNELALPVIRRIRSEDLFQQNRAVEIEHEGKIYQLRLTQMNKLILTA